MSGAVDAGKKVLDVTAFPVVAPAKAAFDLATKGKNPLKSVGESAKKAMGSGMSILDPALEGAGLGKKELPNIAVEDPAAKAEADKRERERIRRQAEIDILTDRPGRGGTILTDRYTYNV
jgi:hypothetical protein